MRSIVRDGEGAISVESLREWGHGAHIAAPVGRIEGECLGEALVRDPVRSRIADLLKKVPSATDDNLNFHVCEGCEKSHLSNQATETCKKPLMPFLPLSNATESSCLDLSGCLWLCKADGTITAASVARNSVVGWCAEAIADAAQQFQQALASGMTEPFRRDLDRLNDVKGFLSSAAAANQTQLFVEALLDRHTEVQHGKFDRGRRKLSWIERKSGRYELTLSQVGDVSGEPKSVDAIRPHEYRLAAADRFIWASFGKAA